MNMILEKLNTAYESVRTHTDFVPKLALILGSGLGGFADHNFDVVKTIPYELIEGFPKSTVEGHAGELIFGYLDKTPIVCMKGRVHYYEGYPISDVVLPVRLLGKLGAEIIFLTNASGGLNESFRAGDLMLITDQISIFAPNPLIGSNIDELGTRFPDMSHVYAKDISDCIKRAAIDCHIDLKEGVYTQLTGPSFESPAEIKMLKALGTDAVGMSTVVEAIAANHMGLKVCGISCVCNLAAGISPTPLSHEEVQAAGAAAAPKFEKLVRTSIGYMAKL